MNNNEFPDFIERQEVTQAMYNLCDKHHTERLHIDAIIEAIENIETSPYFCLIDEYYIKNNNKSQS